MLRTADTSRLAKAWAIAAIVLVAHWVVPGALFMQAAQRPSDEPGCYSAERVALSARPRLVAITGNTERNPHRHDAAAWPNKQPPAANSSSFEMRCPASTPIEPGAAVLAPTMRVARAFEARGPPA